MQAAFIEHDAFQCGYCTPGPDRARPSAMLDEAARAGRAPSPPTSGDEPTLDDAEIRERMSGNLCRCGAYANIVPAITDGGAMRPFTYERAGDAAGAVALLDARARRRASSAAARTSSTS